MPSHARVIPLLVFALVVALIVLEGHNGINFQLSDGAWNLLSIVIPIGFAGGLINKFIEKWKC